MIIEKLVAREDSKKLGIALVDKELEVSIIIIKIDSKNKEDYIETILL